jgi:hypothetical protein
MTRWYMTPAMIRLLALIREHEGGKAGYNSDFRNDDRWTLTNKTFDEFRALGRSQVTTGGARGGKEPSSALGGYQFLTATLDSLKKDLKLTGKEVMSEAFQDDLAVALMNRRGHMKYLRGEMGPEAFANELAKEWASLPVVTRIKGAHRYVNPGQSYYSGDGLNKALHKPEPILAAVKALRDPNPLVTPYIPSAPVPPLPDDPGPTVSKDETVRLTWWQRFWRWLTGRL